MDTTHEELGQQRNS